MSVVEAVLQTLSSLKFESTNADQSDTRPSAFENETLETAEKLRVFHSLETIGHNLGAEESQKTLVPMLGDLVQKAIGAGDDEVLMVIGQKLPDLAEVLGSEGEGASSLIPIISDILVFVEEVVVAQAAADAFCAILPHFSADQVDKKALPLIRKLHEEDLFCASRKVVSKMITACYPLVPSKVQSELKYRLIHLSDNEEEVPLVRSAAILQLVELCRLIGPEIKAELSPLLIGLVGDSQRVVRAACVPPLLELGKLISPETNEYETMIQAPLEKLNEDGSRDTRRALATNMAELQKIAVTKGGNAKSLHTMMTNLLEDNEVETRRIAANQFKDFCLASPQDVQTDFLLPRLQEHLNLEREERVRCELVCCAVGLLPSVRMEDCLPLVRPILAFLNHATDQPKQYVFEYFSQLMSFIPSSEIQLTILPSLVNLWQGKNWRVRMGVVQSLPCLFKTLPENCLRETILPSTLAWLRDPTWAVRDCACRSLARLLSVCPKAATDAIMGTGNDSSSTGGGTQASAAAPSNAGATAPATNSNSQSVAGSSPPGSTGGDAAGGGAGADAQGGSISIATLTANAAARGLKALATDPNYHLRQIFILAVQALWGPGIPDEPVYIAAGEISPNLGLLSPATASLYEFVSAHHGGSGDVAIPSNCSPAPAMPATSLTTCLQLLTQLLTDDPVPNVRFAAARALFFISGNIDKKLAQKQLIPALKKVAEEDKDSDVRFFAQDALTVFN